MSELISIIIPTYNRADTILNSLNSVLNQTYDNLEIIIIDDKSTDNTEDVIKSIDDDRIVYYKLPENKGAGGARNQGVRMASADIIAFHDSDDVCINTRFEKQYTYMQNHPEYALVYSCYLTKENDKDYIFPILTEDNALEGDIFKSLLVQNTVDCPTTMMKKEAFIRNGGFDESYRCIEDWEFIVRFSKEHLLGFINEPLIIKQFRRDGLSLDNEKFFKTRARMIAEEKNMLDAEGLFNAAVAHFFKIASDFDNLDFAKVQLMQALQEVLIKNKKN